MKMSVGGGSTFDQVMPVVLFLGFYNFVNIETAVIASTIWSFKAAVSRHRRGLKIGYMLPTIAVYLLLRSGITIAADNNLIDFRISTEGVYFGIGFATKIFIGVVLALTIFWGKSFMAWIVERAFTLPEGMADDPRFKRTMSTATWFIVAFEILTAIWDIYLYNNTGVNLFVLTRYGVNFILGFLCILGGLLYIERKLSPIPGYRGLHMMLQDSPVIGSKPQSGTD